MDHASLRLPLLNVRVHLVSPIFHIKPGLLRQDRISIMEKPTASTTMISSCNYRHRYRIFSNLPPRWTAARPLRRLDIICYRIERQYLAPKRLELAGYPPLTRGWYRT